MTPTEIEILIEKGLPESKAKVASDDNTHFDAIVICADFFGKPPLRRHQMVYKTLGDLVGGEIHALTIQAITPDEEFQE